MIQLGPNPCLLHKWNCQVFINIKVQKIVFTLRNYYSRIIFQMAVKDPSFKQVYKNGRLIEQLYDIKYLVKYFSG